MEIVKVNDREYIIIRLPGHCYTYGGISWILLYSNYSLQNKKKSG